MHVPSLGHFHSLAPHNDLGSSDVVVPSAVAVVVVGPVGVPASPLPSSSSLSFPQRWTQTKKPLSLCVPVPLAWFQNHFSTLCADEWHPEGRTSESTTLNATPFAAAPASHSSSVADRTLNCGNVSPPPRPATSSQVGPISCVGIDIIAIPQLASEGDAVVAVTAAAVVVVVAAGLVDVGAVVVVGTADEDAADAVVVVASSDDAVAVVVVAAAPAVVVVVAARVSKTHAAFVSFQSLSVGHAVTTPLPLTVQPLFPMKHAYVLSEFARVRAKQFGPTLLSQSKFQLKHSAVSLTVTLEPSNASTHASTVVGATYPSLQLASLERSNGSNVVLVVVMLVSVMDVVVVDVVVVVPHLSMSTGSTALSSLSISVPFLFPAPSTILSMAARRNRRTAGSLECMVALTSTTKMTSIAVPLHS